MRSKEMMNRYKELYDIMASSGDAEKMKIFGNAEQYVFCKLTDIHPDLAQVWLDKLEASVWNNYISSSEYEVVCNKIENLDGYHGGHWSYNEIMSTVTNLQGVVEEAPYYNSYALALTMNMLYSDHSDSVRMYVNEDNIIPFYYAMALDKLKDRDRINFIRPYFNL